MSSSEPSRYIVSGSPVIIPGYLCRRLDRNGLDVLRRHLRDNGITDPELWAILDAIRQSGLESVTRTTPEVEGCSGFGTSEYRSGDDLKRSAYDLDAGAAATRLGVTRRYVTALCANGSIRAYRNAGRWLIPPEDLDAYLEREDLTA